MAGRRVHSAASGGEAAGDGDGDGGMGNPLLMPDVERRVRMVTESCVFKGTTSTVIGFGFGYAMGVFFAAMDSGMPVPGAANTPAALAAAGQPVPTAYQTVRSMMTDAHGRGYHMAKSFAVVGGVFATTECFIEDFRGTHDMYNPILSGCATGGLLGLRVGGRAALFGCAGFAAFSAAIEKFFIRRL